MVSLFRGLMASALFTWVCLAQLNVTKDTTFATLSNAIVDLGFKDLQSANIVAANTTPSSLAKRGTMTCDIACHLLEVILGSSKVARPGSNAYGLGQLYWANQQTETMPTCRILPSQAIEISATLLIVEFTRCKFAVKSGGHANFAGGSNINNGITIDMKGFNTVSLASDKKIATIGTGNRWGHVVDTLSPLGYTVPAGRVWDVGVGGLALGGGISFISNRHGLVMDNIASYEIVLSSGLIATVSETSYPDLYWALRGGGNNFGIVTNFHIYAYPLNPTFWAGFYANNLTTQSTDVFNAFEDFVLNRQDKDLDAQFICTVALGTMVSILTHAAGDTNATAFQRILAIPPIYSTLQQQTLSSFTTFMNSTGPYGYREMFIAFTIKVNATLLQNCLEAFNTEVASLSKDINDQMLPPAFAFQSWSTSVIKHMSDRGGNALGLQNEKNNLLITDLAFEWFNAKDDTRVRAAADSIIAKCTAEAKKDNLFHPYIYQNYATSGQKVFDSYGPTNKAKLQAISKKYDPYQYFQTLEPGYFKLFD